MQMNSYVPRPKCDRCKDKIQSAILSREGTFPNSLDQSILIPVPYLCYLHFILFMLCVHLFVCFLPIKL